MSVSTNIVPTFRAWPTSEVGTPLGEIRATGGSTGDGTGNTNQVILALDPSMAYKVLFMSARRSGGAYRPIRFSINTGLSFPATAEIIGQIDAGGGTATIPGTTASQSEHISTWKPPGFIFLPDPDTSPQLIAEGLNVNTETIWVAFRALAFDPQDLRNNPGALLWNFLG